MKRSISAIAMLLALLVGMPLSAAESTDRPDNTPPEGWTALFNGNDLTGWRGVVNPKQRANLSDEEVAEKQKEADQLAQKNWVAEDGAIVYIGGKGDNLATVKDYGDFELVVDWRVSKKDDDSGIYLRGTPQVQIWGRECGSGGLYNNKKNPSEPLVAADKPAGEWNHFYIKLVGDKVTVKLNGKLVVDNVTMENFWDRDRKLDETGPIELQAHGGRLSFKNIYVREIPRD